MGKRSCKCLLIGLTCAVFACLLVLTACAGPAPAPVLTPTPVQLRFEILECPDEAYIGDYITVSARTPYKETHELQVIQGIKEENWSFVLIDEDCKPDSENVVKWYVQIPQEARAGVIQLVIIPPVFSSIKYTFPLTIEPEGVVIVHNIIVKEPTGSPAQPAPTPTPTPAPTLPQYHSFTFTVKYGELYTFNVYLQNNQTLHLLWKVETSERDALVHILTPSGKVLGFYRNGQFANDTLEEMSCQALEGGVTQFSPSDYAWGEGYYVITAEHIYIGLVTISVEYWIEAPPQSPSSASLPTQNSLPAWTYPQIKQLGISDDSGLFRQTVSRKTLENPSWDPTVLQNMVAGLVRDYEKANPYVEPNHVCRQMAEEFWKILKDNGITSIIVAGNTENQNEWRINFQCDHVWVVVLGSNGLNIGVECTNGTVYSPNYMRPYELACERAYQTYGKSSAQWNSAKAAYDREYSDYEQHLEGYYYLDPSAFEGSSVLWFLPWNW
jgi:hypothetical protein